ncbi:hypothetical protein ACOMHN_004271 [Nucella lapillus]
MKFVWLACVCALVSVTAALSVKQASLDGHNDYRRQEAKSDHASNLYEYEWDEALATNVSKWANLCNFEHQHIHRQGENIYYRSPASHPDDYYIQRALTSWMSEKSYNQDGTFDCCYHHHKCCHYTQVLASKTRTIGCAVAHCAVLKRAGHTISHDAKYVVCEYSPIGNLAFNGNHEAYASGTPCSGCASHHTCNDGLCVSGG